MMSLNQYLSNPVYILNSITAIFYVIWGVSVVKEDWETGKIKNQKLILGLKVLFIILFAHIINTVMGISGKSSSFLNLNFYRFYFINFLYSFAFSYILWYGEIWPAGDSKFFTVNMMFLPLIHNSLTGYPSYLWLFVMINIFILAAVYSIYNYLKDNFTMLNEKNSDAFKEIKSLYYDRLKKINFKSPSTYLTLFNIFTIFIYKHTLKLILQDYIFNIFHRTDIFFFLLFFLWPKISKFFKTKLWKYIMITLYIALTFYFITIPNPLQHIKEIIILSFKNTLQFGSILLIGWIIFEHIIEAHNTIWVPEGEIKEGVIISSKDLQNIKYDQDLGHLFSDNFKDGLDKEQAEAVKNWMKKQNKKEFKIRIIRAKPFAFSIFLGSILQIILNTNIIKYIFE